MIAASMSGKFMDKLEFLDPPPEEPAPDGMSAADAATIRTFGLRPEDFFRKG